MFGNVGVVIEKMVVCDDFGVFGGVLYVVFVEDDIVFVFYFVGFE